MYIVTFSENFNSTVCLIVAVVVLVTSNSIPVQRQFSKRSVTRLACWENLSPWICDKFSFPGWELGRSRNSFLDGMKHTAANEGNCRNLISSVSVFSSSCDKFYHHGIFCLSIRFIGQNVQKKNLCRC